MNKAKALEIAKALFPHYPKTDTFYITSDGQAFENKVHAENQAKTLKDKTVIPVAKADTVTETPEDEATDETPKGAEHIVTEQDLEDNPDWAEKGIKVGDKIAIEVEK